MYKSANERQAAAPAMDKGKALVAGAADEARKQTATPYPQDPGATRKSKDGPAAGTGQNAESDRAAQDVAVRVCGKPRRDATDDPPVKNS
jgi:hypothetical protein